MSVPLSQNKFVKQILLSADMCCPIHESQPDTSLVALFACLRSQRMYHSQSLTDDINRQTAATYHSITLVCIFTPILMYVCLFALTEDVNLEDHVEITTSY